MTKEMYLEYSTKIYSVYLKYIAPEDIFPYSIDEVFIDATNYLNTYQMTARELAMTMIQDVLKTTGITATAGIGTNMYLCKIAMDIVAKHIEPDKDGVRIAELDEMSYRRKLWSHRPITDFWRVGNGYAKKLEEHGLYTMGDMPDDFDIENYTKEVFFMFSGEKVLVDLRCDNSLMKTMVDRFGEDVTTLAYDMTSFRVQTEVSASSTFFGWVFGFNGKVQILAPESVKEQYRQMIAQADEGMQQKENKEQEI